MTELREINLDSFVGGLNLWSTQFTLQPGESPDMLNMEIDPRSGFRTRKGWSRWNAAEAVTPVADWEPRNTFTHSLSTGAYVIYVANNDKIEASPSSAVFATLNVAGPTAVPATASPHLADFAAWGDHVYIACGVGNAAHRRNGVGTPTAATDTFGGFNNDYTTPAALGAGKMPKCEFIETHSGYLFVAYTQETTARPNRLRWSHPSQPENWAELDYIDIDAGGGKITGLRSFRDHLLIFKTDSVWALYGYGSDSWQLVQVSQTAGTPNTTAVTASESSVFFFSSVAGGGIFAYSGSEAPVLISRNLRTAIEGITDTDDIWLGWAGKRLWCSLPWLPDGARVGDESTVFVFDPEVGNGAWVLHRAALGHLTCIVENSDVQVGSPLAVVCGHSGAACLVKLDFNEAPVDVILVALTQTPVVCYYRTGWQYAEFPERRKSWRRIRCIMDQVDETVEVDVNTYFDYDEGSSKRLHKLTVIADGSAFWRSNGSAGVNGFDWGDGWVWGQSGANGSEIVRSSQASTLTGFGTNRAIQMEFSTNASYVGKAWGISLIVLKLINRRFTT